MVGDPLCLQKPMQPEAFATRFIATDHRRRFGQTKARFGLGDFVEQRALGHVRPWCARVAFDHARGEAELPGFFTQFKGHKQHALRCGIMRRCGSLWSSWAFSSMVRRFRVMEKKLTNSGPFMESTGKHSIYTRPSHRLYAHPS